MRLIHYSAHPLPPLTDPRQLAPRLSWGKPRHGLWVSAESGRQDGWRDWCEGSGFGLANLTCATEIVLKRKAKPLRIRTAAALCDFSKSYATTHADIDVIDWEAVMRDWPAIIIAPYQHLHRHNVIWYYGWDCASGVIWDASIIAAVRPAPTFLAKITEPAA